MDFNEKLQYLRKQKNMTQEQLAEKLFVSRTAVSKWESGKGYPNIDSLKSIAAVFEVTIDELLSGDELIAVAKTENNANLKKAYAGVFGILDVASILLIILPLYWNSELGYSVNLFSFVDASLMVSAIYWFVFVALISMGILELLFTRFKNSEWTERMEKISLILGIIATLFFGAVKEPYAVGFIFLLFLAKFFLWIKQRNIR